MTIFRSMRPLHWVKNVIVFAPVFFSGRAHETQSLLLSALAFASFCAVSSAGYMLNDIRDLESDRADVMKQKRPLAAGLIGIKTQQYAIAVSIAVSALIASRLPSGAGISLALYLAATALYSFILKKFWPAGIALIALGMILRIFAGAEAIQVCVSPWVLPCTFFLTAYVVAGKRLFDSERNGCPTPKSLKLFFFTCGLIAAGFYVFYSVSGGKIAQYHTKWLFVTSVPVISGIAQYARLAISGGNGREHFNAVLSDPIIAVSLVSWAAAFFYIIY